MLTSVLSSGTFNVAADFGYDAFEPVGLSVSYRPLLPALLVSRTVLRADGAMAAADGEATAPLAPRAVAEAAAASVPVAAPAVAVPAAALALRAFIWDWSCSSSARCASSSRCCFSSCDCWASMTRCIC